MVSRIALRRFAATLALFSGVACCPNAALAQEHPAAPPAEAPAPPPIEPATKPKAESEKTPSVSIGIPDDPTEVNFDAAIAAFLKVRGWLDSQLMPEINGEESKVTLPG